MGDYDDIKEALGKELSKQKAIFQENAGRAINPDGSDAYWEAKGKFDAADRQIKAIEQELAKIALASEPDYQSILDKLGIVWDKLTGDDDPGDSATSGVRG
ncbi:MAG: hypothetical protein ACTSUB_00665 [Candidatus Thorarchaeota archaeon]